MKVPLRDTPDFFRSFLAESNDIDPTFRTTLLRLQIIKFGWNGVPSRIPSNLTYQYSHSCSTVFWNATVDGTSIHPFIVDGI